MANRNSTTEPRASFPLPAYLENLMGLYMRMLKTQSDRAQSVLERMVAGEYKVDDWVSDATRFWSTLVFDGISAYESLMQSSVGDAVPSTVLILDEPAQGANPMSLPLAVRLQENDRVAPTDFTCLDPLGAPGIPAERFQLKLDPMRNRLLVTPVDIGAIAPGHYLGWVYARKPGPKLPIAAIHLIRLEPESSDRAPDESTGKKSGRKTAAKKPVRRKKSG